MFQPIRPHLSFYLFYFTLNYVTIFYFSFGSKIILYRCFAIYGFEVYNLRLVELHFRSNGLRNLLFLSNHFYAISVPLLDLLFLNIHIFIICSFLSSIISIILIISIFHSHFYLLIFTYIIFYFILLYLIYFILIFIIKYFNCYLQF